MADSPKRWSIVVKCGGNALAEMPTAFFEELARLHAEGRTPIVVHGGGPMISSLLDRLGVKTEFVDGLRKTDEATLDVVEMVLCGSINKDLVRRLQLAGAPAVGLSGSDGLLLEARPVAAADRVGLVGEVVAVNADLLCGIVALGFVPVVAPVGADREGRRYNVNADAAAGAIAARLGAERLVMATDVPGIYRGSGADRRVLPIVTEEEIEAMIASGDITGGMIPKVRAALEGLRGGVAEVVVVDGRSAGALAAAAAGEPIGTRIVRTAGAGRAEIAAGVQADAQGVPTSAASGKGGAGGGSADGRNVG